MKGHLAFYILTSDSWLLTPEFLRWSTPHHWGTHNGRAIPASW